MTVDVEDAISATSADAAMAALVQVTALEHLMASVLEYLARRDGAEAVEAMRDRAKQITQSVADHSENPAVVETAPKALARIDALTELPLSLARIE